VVSWRGNEYSNFFAIPGLVTKIRTIFTDNYLLTTSSDLLINWRVFDEILIRA
jgi:hypothetical protein